MTAFLQCFWFFSQIGFASNRTLVSSFGKVSDPLCTEFPWASFSYFSNFSKIYTCSWKTWVIMKNMQNLHVRKKSHMAYFWKKNNKLSHALLRCAHYQTNPLFELLDAQNMCFGARGRFWTFFIAKKSSIYLQYWQFSINLLWYSL